MARLAAAAVGAEESQALVMSTGVIGVFLPMDKIAAGATAAAAKLGDGRSAFLSAARGILTTDKGMKIASRSVTIGGRDDSPGRHVQRSGHDRPEHGDDARHCHDRRRPDAGRQPSACSKTAVDDSFNCISVEGHMSTNDTVLLLASGAAGKPPLAGDDLASFQAALNELCIELAKQIPDDGEGASHLITIRRRRLQTKGRTPAASPRPWPTAPSSRRPSPAAIPNWGRIVSAAGYAGVPFDPAGVDLAVNGHKLYERGAPVPFDAKTVSAAIKANRETSDRV